MKALSILFVMIAVIGCLAAEPVTVKPFFIIDGDTFLAAPDSVNYRLWGIDAPELDQPWGRAAKAALMDLIHRKRVTVIRHGTSYKRPVVQVTTTNDRDVALELLKMGLAWYTPQFAPKRDDYKKAEAEAREAKRGLWSERNPVNPAEHRQNRKGGDASAD